MLNTTTNSTTLPVQDRQEILDSLPTQLTGFRRREQTATHQMRNPSIKAPAVDQEVLRTATQQLTFFTTEPSSDRKELMIKLMNNLWPQIMQLLPHHPHLWGPQVITYLYEKYLPSTALTYAATIQTLEVWQHLKQNKLWQLAFNTLKRSMQLEPPHGAEPMTAVQARILIGNMTSPLQRAVFQCFVTASRFSESRPTVDAATGNFVERAWRIIPHRTTSGDTIVELHLQAHKGAVFGQRPYSKWVRCNNQLHWWMPHNVQYDALLKYIKGTFPQLSCH